LDIAADLKRRRFGIDTFEIVLLDEDLQKFKDIEQKQIQEEKKKKKE